MNICRSFSSLMASLVCSCCCLGQLRAADITYPAAITAADDLVVGGALPTNKLTVAGAISAMEMKVTSTGADYVFEDGYKLHPLDEVAQYVAREKHLPDIAPAKEMQAEGMPVSEVMTKQLAKIEELTLYAIELKKRNDELLQQFEKIKDDQEAFRKQMLAALAEIKDRH